MTAVMGVGGGEARVPAAIGISIVLHLGVMVGYLFLERRGPKVQEQVISDVQLLLEERAEEAPAVRKAPPPSMSDFLRMALPSAPRPRIPMQVDAPEVERRPMDIPQPKLEDRGRMQALQKMEALDLSRRRTDAALAQAAQPLVERRAVSALDALPKLEEVGTRQAAPKALQLAALAEERRGRIGPQGLGDLSAAVERRQAPKAAGPLLPEAVGRAGAPSALDRLAGLLPEKSSALRGRVMEAPAKKAFEDIAPAAERPKPAAPVEVKRKSVEIEGPLSARKVTGYSLPPFPAWAREMGLIEADVAIRFYVSPDGRVVEDRMRVERTSGYGRLDRLAMEHLKRWRFEARLSLDGDEWGVITFRFLLE